jgi:hypothetical protein
VVTKTEEWLTPSLRQFTAQVIPVRPGTSRSALQSLGRHDVWVTRVEWEL